MKANEVKPEYIEDKDSLLDDPKKETENVKIDLNELKEAEDKLAGINSEEEESLGFNKLYKQVSFDLKSGEENNKNFYRKSSTLSTTISYSGSGHDIFNLKKSNTSQEEINDLSLSNAFFGRNRFYSTPISDYYDGTDNYFKGLNPEKNDYQKSNNYLEKHKYMRDIFYGDYMSYNNEEINNLNIIPGKSSADLNKNKHIITNPPNFTQQYINHNNGKFDNPIYYLPYYNFDCKTINNLINFYK
jgi:hypothetical protein